ncbi:MAG: pimeloyl-CoA dehydrogenase small subunit [Gammaproteobacteria bacterium]|nr:pimeloyl-CoA dehydrogenase small subunit [Gammaproteobacteria bacterium]
MNFLFSEEQMLLQESMAKLIDSDYTFEHRQKNLLATEGYSLSDWATFAQLGWLGVTFDQKYGGFGGGPIELMLMFEQLGKGLVVEPFLPSIVLAGGALNLLGTDAQKQRLLLGLIDGSKQSTLAFAEPSSQYDLCSVGTSLTKANKGYLLNGEKIVVVNGSNADFLVVVARSSGEHSQKDGISLCLVPGNATGIAKRDYPALDGVHAAEIGFSNVSVHEEDILGPIGKGFSVLEEVIDQGTLAIGSEAVGCMEVLYKATVEYCKNRQQFGQAIGTFQVLKHRMVDMFMEYEQAKSLMYIAAMRMDEGYNSEAKKAVSAFKVQVGKSGRFIGQNAVQLHGGMGMTEELSIGHYFKRLIMADTFFGNTDFHINRFGKL